MIDVKVTISPSDSLKAYFYACADCGDVMTVNELKSMFGDDTKYNPNVHVGYNYNNHRYFRQEYFYLERTLNWAGMSEERIKWIEKVLSNVKLIGIPVKTKQQKLF